MLKVSEAGNGSYVYLIISGLKDETVCEKINNRLKDTARIMSDRGFIPNAPGILLEVKEKGLPVFDCLFYETYVSHGILSVIISGHWILRWEQGERILEENVCLNFDLVTGEELALSDIFPKGFDYIGYLEGKYDHNYYYWYKIDYEGNPYSIGDKYDETLEYDGGRLQKLTGNEQFTVFDTGIKIYGINRFDAAYIVPDRDPGHELSADTKYFVTWLDQEYILGYFPMESDPVKIGSFGFTPYGSDEVTVNVYSGEPQEKGEQAAFWEKNMSDGKILEYAKQWAKTWENGSLPYKKIDLYCCVATLYPEEHFVITWSAYGWYNGSEYRIQDWNMKVPTFVHNGKPLSTEEIFDVSYEKLFAEMFTGLKIGQDILTKEEAEKAAKALSPYVAGFLYEPGDDNVTDGEWHWDNWLFRWKTGVKAAPGRPSVLYTDSLTELKESLPKALWEDLTGQKEYRIQLSDPYVILKHLNMYNGYDF